MDFGEVTILALCPVVAVWCVVLLVEERKRRRWLKPSDLPWGQCEECEKRPAVVHCTRHRLHLCWFCMREHDVPVECSYRPVAVLRGK